MDFDQQMAAEAFYERMGHSDFPRGHRENHTHLWSVAFNARSLRNLWAECGGAEHSEAFGNTYLVERLPDWTWDQNLADIRADARIVVRYHVETDATAQAMFSHTEFDKVDIGAASLRLRHAHATDRLRFPDEVRDILSQAPAFNIGLNTVLMDEAGPWLLNLVERTGSVVPLMHSGRTRNGPAYRAAIQSAQDWYKQGLLTDSTVAELEALPGWDWNPDEMEWQSVLKSYRAEYSHGRRPEINRLADRTSRLRKSLETAAAGREHLTARQIDELEALPLWSWTVNDIIPRFVNQALARNPKPGKGIAWWLEANGGTTGLDRILTTQDIRAGNFAAPDVEGYDLDQLTKVITAMSEAGHSWLLEGETADTIRLWRNHPERIHPAVETALNTVTTWDWDPAIAIICAIIPEAAEEVRSRFGLGPFSDTFTISTSITAKELRHRMERHMPASGMPEARHTETGSWSPYGIGFTAWTVGTTIVAQGEDYSDGKPGVSITIWDKSEQRQHRR